MLDEIILSLTGTKGLEANFENLFCTSKLLYHNCSFYDENSEEAFNRFLEIVSDEELSAEEKYDRLMKSI